MTLIDLLRAADRGELARDGETLDLALERGLVELSALRLRRRARTAESPRLRLTGAGRRLMMRCLADNLEPEAILEETWGS